ncbi:MAG: AMP-binding protein [Selenomonas sp.]|uniref:AMP-binding protein n=1 Tax=Selenomonas sp. TaxID=2053611 RepID=UPI0025DF0AB7|nr:AMP-binding protein [Selenomonas sp.]MCR5758723.1 AMP-binding protein [Selenomonas sp.]
MNYYEWFAAVAKKEPQQLFFVMDDEAWSYGEFLAQTDQLQGLLQEKFPENCRGGSYLLLGESPVEQLAGFLALQALHIRPVLLHHGLAAADIAAIMDRNQLQGLITLVREKGKGYEVSIRPTGYEKKIHAEADILGVLSSGSTGVPKVMYRTYESWAGFFPIQNPIFHVDGHTRLFLQGSLSFTGNLNALLSVLYEGGSIITCRKMRCRHWADWIERFQANVLYLVPAKLQLLTAAVKGTLPSVGCLFTGSQLLSPRNIRDIQRLLPAAEILLYYGASELNYISYAICDDPDRDSRNLGRPFPGVKIRIQDGLIFVDTAYHVSGARIPFSVKDTGFLNDKGELIFEGRREAWVNKGGVKLSLTRLENKLRSIPGIQTAVLVACADSLRGSDFAAFVVKDEAVAGRVIRSRIRQALRPVEMPAKVLFLPQMPLNDRGKVAYPVLQEKLKA